MNRVEFISDPIEEFDIDKEDHGQAKIVSLNSSSPGEVTGDGNSGLFVRLHSYTVGKDIHPELDRLIKLGKRYRVVIEEVEE